MNKIESLQGLRGFAILMIMISHCCYLKNAVGSNALVMLGGLGVELFIILSGYLACYWNFDNFTDNSKIDVKKSYIRTLNKVKKYYLLHVLTMFVAVIIQWESIGVFIHKLYKLILDLLLLQAWYPNMSVYFSYNAVAWYLSCVTFFIFMTPYVIKYLRKLDGKQIFNLIIKIVIFEFIWAFVLPNEKIGHWLVYVFPIIRLLDFVLGGGIYVLLKRTSINIKCINELTMSMITLGILFMLGGIEYSILEKNDVFYTVAPWTLPAITLVLLLAKFHKYDVIFKFPPLVFIGNISFELFLWHLLIRQFVWGINELWFWGYNDIQLSNITIITSIIMAYIYHKYLPSFIIDNYNKFYDRWILKISQ